MWKMFNTWRGKIGKAILEKLYSVRENFSRSVATRVFPHNKYSLDNCRKTFSSRTQGTYSCASASDDETQITLLLILPNRLFRNLHSCEEPERETIFILSPSVCGVEEENSLQKRWHIHGLVCRRRRKIRLSNARKNRNREIKSFCRGKIGRSANEKRRQGGEIFTFHPINLLINSPPHTIPTRHGSFSAICRCLVWLCGDYCFPLNILCGFMQRSKVSTYKRSRNLLDFFYLFITIYTNLPKKLFRH